MEQLEFETTQQFTYLGSTVCNDGGGRGLTSTSDRGLVKLVRPLQNCEPCGEAETTVQERRLRFTKLVYSLYYCMDLNDLKRLQRFHTPCLRKILHIFWPEKISNNALSKLTEQEDMSIVLTRKRWNWVGHVFRREFTNISRVVLRWTPQGKTKRGRPKSTWRRTAEAELQALNLTWWQASRLAKD